jgi:hypothetical protein
MVLTRGDDYPLHQTPEPVAYAGTDRNFYDRYFFNGYHAVEGETFFAAALGVYPHLNIMDAAFCVTIDGVQTNLHASKWLHMERLDLKVGPIQVEIVEPLQVLRIKVDSPEHGLKADVTITGRAFPIEEPRFIRRQGPRAFMDYTRLTQNGRWSGWIERDGQRVSVDGYVGTRDRSWGVRPVGTRDSQEIVPPVSPQFYWLWSPTNFAEGSFFFHTNEDAEGTAWNRRGVWQPDGAEPGHIDEISSSVEWASNTRHARSAVVRFGEGAHESTVTYEPQSTFFMLGLGYGHPKWGHGFAHGELAVEREDFKTSEVDVHQPHHLHIQALSKVTYRSGEHESVGRGVLEQLVLGPHKPSGFTGMLDFAR